MKYEKMDIRDLIRTDTIEPLIVFESNKEYVNDVLSSQVDLRPYNMEYVTEAQLPSNWASFRYQDIVNQGGAPSEIVENLSKGR
jgi:hypothetical protein